MSESNYEPKIKKILTAQRPGSLVFYGGTRSGPYDNHWRRSLWREPVSDGYPSEVRRVEPKAIVFLL